MANMSESQRAQYERAELGFSGDRLSRATTSQERVWAILTVIFGGVLIALSIAAIQVFDGWDHLIVIADLVILFFAVAIWLNRDRRT